MKLSARQKYILDKLAFTDEIQWRRKPAWVANSLYKKVERIEKVYPSIDGQDISCVMRTLRKAGLARCFLKNENEGPLHITVKGIAALLETVK